ncbi:MAG TPA: hypothetical protein VJR02_19890 [Pyrinomonadaceae bacterium]|nr:hypothetical protein [Pyrinomonadaceae bacterium]
MTPILAAFFEFSSTALWMSVAGIALLVIGLLAAKNDIARARGLDRIVALAHVCFAIPLAMFGAEHLSLGSSMLGLVPPYMPGRLFWIYFVGVALIVAALSIATRIQVRWSGLLFGIMMVLFVAMIHLPGAVKSGDRIIWTIVFREMSFAGGGFVLAGIALGRSHGKGKGLITVGRVLIAITAILFGVLHFLHPLGVPGVPLAKQMPAWIPARAVIDYVTGAFLIVGGVCFLLARKTRMAAAYLGTWILLLVVGYYGPMLIGALADPSFATRLEGLNYFADTLLFGGTILSLAYATTSSD